MSSIYKQILKERNPVILTMEKPLVRQYVGRAVVLREDKVLLVNVLGEPYFFLPGGRLEDGESLRDCVRREIKEELDATAEVGDFIGCIEHGFETETKRYYEVGFFFTVSIPGLPHRDNISNEDELQFKWTPIDELHSMDVRPPPLRDLLKKLHSKQRFNGYWSTTVEHQTRRA